MTDPLLEVSGLVVRFGAVQALSEVSFTVSAGSIHSIIGPNGAGKSSLLNVLSGLYRAASGTVSWNGESLLEMRPDQIARRGIGRSFQNVGLAGQESVAENIMFGRHLLMTTGMLANGLRLPEARRQERAHRERVAEIAEFVGLTPWLDSPVAELSYGHQKRVDLARALATEPRMLLLDEPAAGMNATEKGEIARLIRSVVDSLGMTVLLVEHDMEMVMGLSHRITVLNFGRVIAEGTPSQIQADPEVIGAYLGGAAEVPQ